MRKAQRAQIREGMGGDGETTKLERLEGTKLWEFISQIKVFKL